MSARERDESKLRALLPSTGRGQERKFSQLVPKSAVCSLLLVTSADKNDCSESDWTFGGDAKSTLTRFRAIGENLKLADSQPAAGGEPAAEDCLPPLRVDVTSGTGSEKPRRKGLWQRPTQLARRFIP